MMVGGIYDPVSLVDHAVFGAVKPDNAVETLGRIAVFDGGVRTLTDAQGHAMRFREYLERPGGVSLGLFPIEGNGCGEGLPIVCELKHHADVRVEDRMARFLVEASRALVGGDAEYQLSAVVCRPGVAERLDLQSDAFAPMLPDDRDPFDEGCMLGESLSYLCGMDPARPGAVYERLGYAKGWLDEGRAYQTVLSPYAYVRRPDRSIIVSDDCWDALIEVFDVPDEQALDCLCLAIRCGGAWPVDGGGGGAMV